MSNSTNKSKCTCDDLTELQQYHEEHYDDCPLSTFKPPKSNCCGAPITVAGDEDSQRWNECSACKQPCDPAIEQGVGELKACPWCGNVPVNDPAHPATRILTHTANCWLGRRLKPNTNPPWQELYPDFESDTWNTRTQLAPSEEEESAVNADNPQSVNVSQANLKSSAAQRQAFDDGYLGGVLTGHDEGFQLGYKDGVAAERERFGLIADLWGAGVSCHSHDDDPCCHVRTGHEIAKQIRSSPTTQPERGLPSQHVPDNGQASLHESSHAALHRLWTKAVGQENYVKDEWRELEAAMFASSDITSLTRESDVESALAELREMFPSEEISVDRYERLGALGDSKWATVTLIHAERSIERPTLAEAMQKVREWKATFKGEK